jgi:integrase
VRGELRIVSREGAETKTGRSRTVPMLGPVREAIDAVRHVKRRKGAAHRVYPSRGTRKTVATAITHRWARVVREIARTDPRVPVITFHGLRHSFATWMASSGLPLASLQLALGHASISMTMRYVHVQPSHMHDQIRAIAGEGGTHADP